MNKNCETVQLPRVLVDKVEAYTNEPNSNYRNISDFISSLIRENLEKRRGHPKMSQQLITSCNDSGEKFLTTFEFDDKKTTKYLCQECINFIKNSDYGKIIPQSPLQEQSN